MKTLTFLCLLCVIATLGYAGCGTATICNFGCCPFPFATCCKGWKACCPHGMTCDGIAKKCFNTEKFEAVDMFFA
ncbi:hypothetical protein L596_010323 [Steinernema carpocapsae]|uniref:Granulins domain-containing protein n=1 Tax=Steinernema carpocapsae TaxID=34508 RepID=A0A4U5PI74_STECR|nr:hypothetical protein L596_010323 [Steinernema carpocapsae]